MCSKVVCATSLTRCGCGGVCCSANRYGAEAAGPGGCSSVLIGGVPPVGPVEQVLARVHDVVRVERALDLEHDVEPLAELLRQQVDLALAARAVAGAHGPPVGEGHRGDVPLGLHPGGPG